jgi:hypothetical protein
MFPLLPTFSPSLGVRELRMPRGLVEGCADMALLDDYYSCVELAEELNRTPRTLGRWRSQGIGPPVTLIQQTPFYRIASVQTWLLSQVRQFVAKSDVGRAVSGSLKAGNPKDFIICKTN